jgi:hypothetical protein
MVFTQRRREAEAQRGFCPSSYVCNSKYLREEKEIKLVAEEKAKSKVIVRH